MKPFPVKLGVQSIWWSHISSETRSSEHLMKPCPVKLRKPQHLKSYPIKLGCFVLGFLGGFCLFFYALSQCMSTSGLDWISTFCINIYVMHTWVIYRCHLIEFMYHVYHVYVSCNYHIMAVLSGVFVRFFRLPKNCHQLHWMIMKTIICYFECVC